MKKNKTPKAYHLFLLFAPSFFLNPSPPFPSLLANKALGFQKPPFFKENPLQPLLLSTSGTKPFKIRANHLSCIEIPLLHQIKERVHQPGSHVCKPVVLFSSLSLPYQHFTRLFSCILLHCPAAQ